MIATLINNQSENPDSLPVARMCALAQLDRRTYYRLKDRAKIGEERIELRDYIQPIALEWPSYGYRRVTRELSRQGKAANNKLVLRLMREDNLLCLHKRHYVSTTDSRHSLLIYPNLAGQMTLTDIDQSWATCRQRSSSSRFIQPLHLNWLCQFRDAVHRQRLANKIGRRSSSWEEPFHIVRFQSHTF
jgi:transposase InsO family protein